MSLTRYPEPRPAFQPAPAGRVIIPPAAAAPAYFTAVGSPLYAGNGPLSLTPVQAGDLITLTVMTQSATVYCTGVSSTNVTWEPLAADPVISTAESVTQAVFTGTVTSTGTADVTPSWSGTPGSYSLNAQEFSCSTGAWVLDATGLLDTVSYTNTWPAPTPAGAAELYWGNFWSHNTAVAGTTPGYTYKVDSWSNGTAYNTGYGPATPGPTWANSPAGFSFGLAVLIKAVPPGKTVYPAAATAAGESLDASPSVPVTAGAATAAGQALNAHILPPYIIATADWLMSTRLADGAICNYPDKAHIKPYEAGFGACGLALAAEVTGNTAYATAVWDHCDWYAAHQDTVTGYVTDYTVTGGVETTTGTFDSTDSYAGMSLTAMWAAWRVTGDQSRLDALHDAVTRAVHAIESTQDTDGLTFATPTYLAKLLMDQCETYTGLRSASVLASALGDATLSIRATRDANAMLTGVQSMWNAGNSSFNRAVNGYAGGYQEPAVLTDFYPDTCAEVFTVWAHLASATQAGAIMPAFTSGHPSWDDPGNTDYYGGVLGTVGYWPVLAWSLENYGDSAAALAGAASIRAYALAHSYAWDYNTMPAGQLLIAEASRSVLLTAPGRLASPYDAMVLADRPAAWWRLSDPVSATVAADISGSGQDASAGTGVTFGQPGPVAGFQVETAALFDNSANGLSASFSPSRWTAVTVEAWVNLGGSVPAQWPCTITANSQTDVDLCGFNLMLDTYSGQPAPKVMVGSGAGWAYASSVTTVPVTGWHQVAFTWNGTTGDLLLYLDGSQVASGSLTGMLADGGWGGTYTGKSGYWSQGFPGSIAQVSVTPAVLDATRLAARYQAARSSVVLPGTASGTGQAPGANIPGAGGPRRVNTQAMYAKGTTADPLTVTIPTGTGVKAGDLLVAVGGSNGTHVTNGLAVSDAVNGAWTSLGECQESVTANRWQQVFILAAPADLADGTVITLTPSAAATSTGLVADVFRGASATQSRAIQSAYDSVSDTAASAPALTSAPPAGDLVIQAAGGNAQGLAPPGTITLASENNQTTAAPILAIGWAVADGSSTYGTTWTASSATTSGGQTVAFAAAGTGGISPQAASGTGEALNPQATGSGAAVPAAADGTGAAPDAQPSGSGAAAPTAAGGTGESLNPQPSGSGTALPQAAGGTGEAPAAQPSGSGTATPLPADGAGYAYNPVPFTAMQLTVYPLQGEGTGQAPDAAVTSLSLVIPLTADGSGQAYNPQPSYAVTTWTYPVTAGGAGEALDAVPSGSGTAVPDTAAGAGEAWQPGAYTASVTLAYPLQAQGGGEAPDPSARSVSLVTPDTPQGTGQAPDAQPAGSGKAVPAAAAGAGEALNGTGLVLRIAAPPAADGTGQALDVSFRATCLVLPAAAAAAGLALDPVAASYVPAKSAFEVSVLSTVTCPWTGTGTAGEPSSATATVTGLAAAVTSAGAVAAASTSAATLAVASSAVAVGAAQTGTGTEAAATQSG